MSFNPGFPSSVHRCLASRRRASRAGAALSLRTVLASRPGSLSRTLAGMASGVVVTLTAVTPVSQTFAPPAAYAGVCGGPCGHCGRCCGAVVGLPSCEGCTDGAETGVAVCGAANGVVRLVRVWEEAAEELDTAASALSVCTLSAARFGPSGAFWAVPGARPRVTLVGVVSHRVRFGCCRHHHGRSPAALLKVACGFGFECPPIPWTPAAVSVSEGSVVRSLLPGRVDRRGPDGGG